MFHSEIQNQHALGQAMSGEYGHAQRLRNADELRAAAQRSAQAASLPGARDGIPLASQAAIRRTEASDAAGNEVGSEDSASHADDMRLSRVDGGEDAPALPKNRTMTRRLKLLLERARYAALPARPLPVVHPHPPHGRPASPLLPGA